MNHKKIFKLLGALIFVVAIVIGLILKISSVSAAASVTPISAETPALGQISNAHAVEICVHVTGGTSSTHVTAVQQDDLTKTLTFSYNGAHCSNAYSSPAITGTGGGVLTCTDPPAQTDELAITAKSADGKSSALGEITNLCQLPWGSIYNTKPALTLIAGQSSITVKITAQLIEASCSTNVVNTCTPEPIIADDIGPGTATLTPSGGSGIPLNFSGLGQTGSTTTATAVVPVTATPTTYTLSIPYKDSAGVPYEVETGQTTYTLDSSSSNPFNKTVTLIGSTTTPGGGDPGTTTSCPPGDETSACQGQTVVCSTTFFNPISWFVCPIVSSIQDIMNTVGSTITSYLTIPSSYFNPNSNTGQPMYEAWNSVRDISLSLLAIVALVMIFSQALSIGPFDAYTVKKILPRLIIAAILITLSWPLIGLAIGISNGLGDGIRYIIYEPFRNLQNVNFSGGDEALVGGLGIGGALGLFGILTLGIMAALALFTGLVIIVIRQIVVILLAILAPLALVLYILPGTEKAWKLWWNSFWGALIMFPLIEAFIALGSVFSKIAMSGGNTGVLDKIIAYIAIYLPYFLLPATIRLSGGMMQAVGGVVTRGSRGIQGGLSKRRKESVARNIQQNRGYQRFNGENALSKGLNKTYGAIFAGPRGWAGSGGRARRTQNKMVGETEWLKGNAAWQASGQFDAPAIQMATDFGSSEAAKAAVIAKRDSRIRKGDSPTEANVELQQNLNAIERGKAVGMYTQLGQIAAFNRRGEMGGLGIKDSTEVRRIATRIAGGDSYVGVDTNLYGNLVSTFEHNAEQSAGYLSKPASDIGAPLYKKEFETWNATDLTSQMRQKPISTQHYVDFYTQELASTKNATSAIDEERRLNALQFFVELRRGAPAGSGINAGIANEALSKPVVQDNLREAFTNLDLQIKAGAVAGSNPRESSVQYIERRSRSPFVPPPPKP